MERVRSLESLLREADHLHGVRKADLRAGDSVLVTTRNSTYVITFLGENQYSVYGGWFDRNTPTPATIGINGCTWGGCAIKTDLVAAPGLLLEFGNTVTTSRIRQVQLIPSARQ